MRTPRSASNSATINKKLAQYEKTRDAKNPMSVYRETLAKQPDKSVVLVTVGVASVLSLRRYVTTMTDAEVAKSLHAFNNSYTRYRNGEHTSAHQGVPPVSQALLEFTGQTPGNLIALLHDGEVIGSASCWRPATNSPRRGCAPSRRRNGTTVRHAP